MHFNPDPAALEILYVAGLGLRPAQPMVTVDGVSWSLNYGRGHDPAWAAPGEPVWCPQDDTVVQGTLAQGVPTGNSLTAALGRVATHRTDPHRILFSYRPPMFGATDPVFSADGKWLAYLRPDEPHAGVSTLWVERTTGRDARILDVGALRVPRFSHTGTTLTWEAGEHIAGCPDVANPAAGAVSLSTLADRLSKPVAVWAGAYGLHILAVQALSGDTGETVLLEWGSAERAAPVGYRVYVSGGAGFAHAACAIDGQVYIGALSPAGTLVRRSVDLRVEPPVRILPPPPVVVIVPPVDPPVTLPDIPWRTTPNGVVEDLWPWLAPRFTALSPDGRVGFILKSDEVSADGVTIGEWWDHDERYIGHLEDASTGHRIYQGKRYYAHEWVARGQPVPWASLPLARNRFDDGARLWMPRRCETGQRFRYVTNIRWNNGYVQPNIPIEIRVEVGYGRFNGHEAFVRGFYIPGGNAEENWYGPTGWVRHIPAGVA